MNRAARRRGVALVAVLAVLAAFGALLVLRASAQALQIGALAAQVRAANADADADAALLLLRARWADAPATVPLDGAWRSLPDPWSGRWRASADPRGVRLEVETTRGGAVARREALVGAPAADGSSRSGHSPEANVAATPTEIRLGAPLDLTPRSGFALGGPRTGMREAARGSG